jgi:hypothetical protein
LQEESWKYCLSQKAFRWEAVASLSLLGVMTTAFSRFLTWAEQRPGYTMYDPILASFDPIETSIFIFVLTYGSVFTIILIHRNRPRILVQMMQLYFLLLVIRTVCIYMLPLYAPDTIIVLNDPILDNYVYQVHNIRDLFFSGHTAVVFLFALTLESRSLKRLFMIVAVVLGILLLAQHVHFTLDVVVAPFIAWFIYWIQTRISRKWSLSH